MQLRASAYWWIREGFCTDPGFLDPFGITENVAIHRRLPRSGNPEKGATVHTDGIHHLNFPRIASCSGDLEGIPWCSITWCVMLRPVVPEFDLNMSCAEKYRTVACVAVRAPGWSAAPGQRALLALPGVSTLRIRTRDQILQSSGRTAGARTPIERFGARTGPVGLLSPLDTER